MLVSFFMLQLYSDGLHTVPSCCENESSQNRKTRLFAMCCEDNEVVLASVCGDGKRKTSIVAPLLV